MEKNVHYFTQKKSDILELAILHNKSFFEVSISSVLSSILKVLFSISYIILVRLPV